MDKLAIFRKLTEKIPGLELKGATMPYTSLNGNMFTFFSKDGELSLRLGAEQREEFIKKYNSRLSVQHGVVMKEYVIVTDELFNDEKSLEKWLNQSFSYALTLKPKPTKR